MRSECVRKTLSHGADPRAFAQFHGRLFRAGKETPEEQAYPNAINVCLTRQDKVGEEPRLNP